MKSVVIVIMTSLLLTGIVTLSMSQRSYAHFFLSRCRRPVNQILMVQVQPFPFPLIDTWQVPVPEGQARCEY